MNCTALTIKITAGQKTPRFWFVFFLVGLLTYSITLPPYSFAENANPDEINQGELTEALEELVSSMNIEAFEYNTENRSDPFMPFISAKIDQPVDIDMSTERLSGMRQFEPGQLKLVAIMFTEANPMAMVEDSAGKGYLIRRGTKIGKSGIISDIVPNHVIIKQLTYSMTRERKYKTVEMILRKEGEHQ